MAWSCRASRATLGNPPIFGAGQREQIPASDANIGWRPTVDIDMPEDIATSEGNASHALRWPVSARFQP